MNSFSKLEQAILDMATEGQLSAILRVVQPSEGSIPCMCAVWGSDDPPPHCLQTVNPGDQVAHFKPSYDDWSEEERQQGSDDHPECLHCEVKSLAFAVAEGLEHIRPRPLGHDFLTGTAAGVAEGYVDPVLVLEATCLGKHEHEGFAAVFGYIWATEQAAQGFGLPRDPRTQEEHAEALDGLLDYEVAVFDWVQKRRAKVKGMVESLATDHYLADAVARNDAAMLLRACEGLFVPNVALQFLREAAGLPSHADDKEMKHLLWVKGWMKHLSTPGSKVVFRRGGKIEPQPYPEEGRQQAITNLARVEQEIEKRNAELNRPSPNPNP